MRWLIIYLLLIAIIWLFIKNTQIRRGMLALATIFFAGFMLLFTLIEKDIGSEVATVEKFDQARQREAIQFTAIKPSDIAISGTSLKNPLRTVFDSAGREQTQPDLFKWQLETSLTNRSTDYTVGSITLQLNLYSCPQFYSVSQADIDPAKLSANCARIGSRSIGLSELLLKAGESLVDKRTVTFPNQPEPRNPRYWLEVQSATAARQ
jgi:hypothetical protein